MEGHHVREGRSAWHMPAGSRFFTRQRMIDVPDTPPSYHDDDPKRRTVSARISRALGASILFEGHMSLFMACMEEFCVNGELAWAARGRGE